MTTYVRGLLLLLVLALILGLLPSRQPEQANAHAEFGGVSLNIDYALSEASREKGLGGRLDIPDDYGMLFVFPKDGFYGFWMKDTLVPLDMFWLDAQGHVVSIAPDVQPDSYPHVFYPSSPARYVLETRAGFAHAHSVGIGTPLLLNNLPTVSK
jgi:uncharacterized membrane protein (UPF0127 family)